ncbi:MAG: S8 family serine peptidase [Phycisphaerae bacterium]|nr:S8 family serine peptidase [Phycisphaerae bacterium]
MRAIGRSSWSVVVALWIALAGGLATGQEAETSRDVVKRSIASQKRRPSFVPGEVIVQFKTTGGAVRTHDTDLLRLRSKFGVENAGPVFQRVHEQARRGKLGASLNIASAQRSRDLLRFYVLKTERDVESLCEELAADPAVEFAQPNYIYHICQTPNDPEFPDQYAHQLIQMEDAWDISTGSRDVVVAILGTGTDVNHPDLKDNIWVNAGEIPGNQIDDDGNGFVDDVHGWNFRTGDGDMEPWDSHETQVAGVIAAVGNNGKGVVGVNWQCSVMVLQLSEDFKSDDVAGSLDYAAANGARIVNMSFGGDEFGPAGDVVVRTAIDSAYEQGVLLVASAGNSDTSRVVFPAGYPNVLAVASTNGEDVKTGHSTFGNWVDIAAPGTDIVTTTVNEKYVATAGTSFSSPYVAAVAALLFAHRPDLTSLEARAILENTTDPVYYGDVDPNAGYIGTGRVNAYSALLAADEPQPLGEVFSPAANQVYASDGNAIDLCVFAYGDTYRLDYRVYGVPAWTAICAGDAPSDPNALVRLSLPNPGVGTYELRIRVTRGGRTHTDYRSFGVTDATPQTGWPTFQDATPDERYYIYYMSSPICMDIDGDGRTEIIHSLVDYSGYIEESTVDIWTADGRSLPNWPVDLGYAWATGLAVGDIDGDGDYEVVVSCEYDGEVYAYHIDTGELVEDEWPAWVGGYYGYVTAGPVLADLDGDGDSEILVALDYESSSTDGLIALQGDGTPFWARRYTSEGPLAAADMDRDGDVEIGLSGYGPGLTTRLYTFLLDSRGQQIARWKGGSPKGVVFADLEGDGTTEMVFCAEEEVLAVRADGTTVWRTKTDDSLDSAGGICVGDLDGDGLGEVYVNTLVESDEYVFTRVYAFDHQGKLRTDAGWPKSIMGTPLRCIPLIADIDGDGLKELIVAPGGEPFMAWEADGSVTPGFPMLNLAADVQVSPAVADLDADGDIEIMVAADDFRFHVLDLPGSYAPELVDWGQAHHDAQNSGWTAPAPQLDTITVPTEVRPGERVEVHVTASNPANLPLRWSVGNLPNGAWYDPQTLTLHWKPTVDQAFATYTLSFVVTDGVRQFGRDASVTVVPDAIYSTSMDTDPGWTLEEGWAWGDPNAQGSWTGDPNDGHTGSAVLGYALAGDYPDGLGETRYATTGPIDCTGFTNIRLSFWRWLVVEAPYDYACVQVSNDGATWTDLWTTGQSHISDSAWQYVEYAVPSGIADGRSTVWFRWGMGPTDDWISCPGWNLDDVQVTGKSAAQSLPST